MRAWHLVTGEYPPAPGGVSDYTAAVAAGLAGAGDTVDVWCPGAPGVARDPAGVRVHRSRGCWSADDIRAFDEDIDAAPGPRRLVVQWVPHAFGQRSMNLGFCRWVASRARRGDQVDLMVHEPFLAFGLREGRLNAVAAVHRVMTMRLLKAARRVWVSVPLWARLLKPWALGRDTKFCWLPVPSTLRVDDDQQAIEATRARIRDGATSVVGHFGTYDRPTSDQLDRLLPGLAGANSRLLLLGRGGDVFRSRVVERHPAIADRVLATGGLPANELSRHLRACDLLVQPYIDGASTRRTTLMAGLAHGVPVVTTVGRLSEPFWADSPAVTAVPAGDSAAVLAAAAALALDPARRQAQSDAARALYAARFDIRHVIDALRADRCDAVGAHQG
jgi:glycosyltransferase involved in cell wall biosynthesis